MLPALLITFREVIEATLIVVTILGVLTKLKNFSHIKTVWLATIAATLVSTALLLVSSVLGVKIQELYAGRTEQIFEGTMMLTSAVFITWAVFWLHKYFSRYKLVLLQKVKHTIFGNSTKGLFALVFTAVFREGFEIVLFLSTIYLSANPAEVLTGFGLGSLLALGLCLLLFTATVKLPVFYAFQASTLLLILFAAGLATSGVHEFTEAGMLPELAKITFQFLPPKGYLSGDMIKTIFGWSRSMDYLQLGVWAGYVAFMRWYLYRRQPSALTTKEM